MRVFRAKAASKSTPRNAQFSFHKQFFPPIRQFTYYVHFIINLRIFQLSDKYQSLLCSSMVKTNGFCPPLTSRNSSVKQFAPFAKERCFPSLWKRKATGRGRKWQEMQIMKGFCVRQERNRPTRYVAGDKAGRA